MTPEEARARAELRRTMNMCRAACHGWAQAANDRLCAATWRDGAMIGFMVGGAWLRCAAARTQAGAANPRAVPITSVCVALISDLTVRHHAVRGALGDLTLQCGLKLRNRLARVKSPYAGRLFRLLSSLVLDDLEDPYAQPVGFTDEAMSVRDARQLLRLSGAATRKEVSKAFRIESRQCHPDRNPNDDKAAARFLAATRARDVLLEYGAGDDGDDRGGGGDDDRDAPTGLAAVDAGRLALHTAIFSWLGYHVDLEVTAYVAYGFEQGRRLTDVLGSAVSARNRLGVPRRWLVVARYVATAAVATAAEIERLNGAARAQAEHRKADKADDAKRSGAVVAVSSFLVALRDALREELHLVVLAPLLASGSAGLLARETAAARCANAAAGLVYRGGQYAMEFGGEFVAAAGGAG